MRSRVCECEPKGWPDGEGGCGKCGKPLTVVEAKRPPVGAIERARREKIARYWRGRRKHNPRRTSDGGGAHGRRSDG